MCWLKLSVLKLTGKLVVAVEVLAVAVTDAVEEEEAIDDDEDDVCILCDLMVGFFLMFHIY